MSYCHHCQNDDPKMFDVDDERGVCWCLVCSKDVTVRRPSAPREPEAGRQEGPVNGRRPAL